ncbi:PASTA domain, binds beta-lactams [Flexibacter flexilis DSM 6793]|uniref:PASTA domain, binds beta-lactams n=1 Tax=Flexibacter flexilis DSM 6793 TaxID=927664 RepID=A0A1I1KVV4_9BACT|nr:PASTA domain-containing protein [Flexibacter flexilis]SFC61580.1 PASTA domain, binds beta-lactams [Flexibacter flexilis DSM 6793]
MKFSFKAQTPFDVLLHLLIIVAMLVIMVLSFFYIYLPITTNHNETVTVPKVVGMRLADLENVLGERDLEYVVDDSIYKPGAEPFTVHKQFPFPDEKVKAGRKIYVEIYSKQPPLVKMPNLLNRTLINAQDELLSYDLLLGKTEYVPDLQLNSVIKQRWNGQEVAEGTPIPKGSRIDLIVGNGQGNTEFELANYVGMPRDEAELAITGVGLQIDVVTYDNTSTLPPGTIIKQKPSAGTKTRAGEVVDIWVAGEDPAKSAGSEGDGTEAAEEEGN